MEDRILILENEIKSLKDKQLSENSEVNRNLTLEEKIKARK
jgi:hypothetical protein